MVEQMRREEGEMRMKKPSKAPLPFLLFDFSFLYSVIAFTNHFKPK